MKQARKGTAASVASRNISGAGGSSSNKGMGGSGFKKKVPSSSSFPMCLTNTAAAVAEYPAPGDYHGDRLHGGGRLGVSGPAYTMSAKGGAVGRGLAGGGRSSRDHPGPGAYQDLKSFPNPLGRVVGKPSVLKHSSAGGVAGDKGGYSVVGDGFGDRSSGQTERLNSSDGLGQNSLRRTAGRRTDSSAGGTGRRVSWADSTQFRDSLDNM